MSCKLMALEIALLMGILLNPRAYATDLTLTIIYDNNPYKDHLETRWGFSCVVQGPEKTILFDVGGEGAILLSNMEKLKIDRGIIDILVLSHVHYDHIGGLADFLGRSSDVTVYVPNSFPTNVKRNIRDTGADIVEVEESLKICKHVYSTGELGVRIKEQSLMIETSKGLVVITGCAHPGIVHIVQKAKTISDLPVYLVLGGFHLRQMNAQELDQVIRGLRREGVRKAAPCHCSGDLARDQFKKAYEEDFILAGAGRIIKIGDAF